VQKGYTMNLAMPKGKGKVLLVDDDGTLRALYVDVLEREGLQVDQAVEGKEGLEKAKQGGYDLVLLDFLLPGLEGTQILKELKENPPQKANGPIVMLTNSDQVEVIEKCKALGAAGAIIKSTVVPDQLVQRIQGYLKDQHKG